MNLTRDQILAARPMRCEEIDIPELGGIVRVRMMSAGDRERYESGLIDDTAGDARRRIRVGELAARLVVFSVVDAEGRLVFSEQDIPQVAALDADVVRRIADVATRLNKIGAAAAEAAGKN